MVLCDLIGAAMISAAEQMLDSLETRPPFLEDGPRLYCACCL